jgi:acyl-CoA thioesterase-2
MPIMTSLHLAATRSPGTIVLMESAAEQPSFLTMMVLEPHGPDTFVATGPRYPWGGLYGGQIIAQALRAASLTVDPAYGLHSLHAYFIRLGDAAEPIRLEVDRIRNGRSFLTRRVVARQSGGAILNLSSSFQVAEEGPEVWPEEMPQVAAPEDLREDGWSGLVERRPLPEDIAPGRIGAWMRLTESIGNDPILNACALAYLSDDLPTDAVVARHPNRAPRDSGERRFWNASLDHAIWFHHPTRANEWHLHDFSCRGLVGTRGLSIGSIFDRSGRHAATVSQEVLIRPRRPE